jgi:hypothetical protein
MLNKIPHPEKVFVYISPEGYFGREGEARGRR